MVAKPGTIALLDTNETNRVAPAGSKITDGYVLDDLFSSSNANYLMGWHGDFTEWLNERVFDNPADTTTNIADRVGGAGTGIFIGATAFNVTHNTLLGNASATPDRLLHLEGSSGGAAFLRLERNDTTLTIANQIGVIEFEHQDTDDAGVACTIEAVAEAVTGECGLVFTTGAPAGRTEQMRIDASGDVGVGTTTPNAIGAGITVGKTLSIVEGTVNATLTVRGATRGEISLEDTGSGVDDKIMQLSCDGGVTKFRALTDALGLQADNIFTMDHGTGHVAFGGVPSATIPVLIADGTNITATGVGAIGHIVVAGSGYSGHIALDGTGMHLGTNSASRSISLQTDETERLFVTGGGNVGIGETSPDQLLHISSDTAPALRFTRTDETAVAGESLGLIEFETTDLSEPGVSAQIEAQATDAIGNSQLVFRTGNAGAALNEALFIDSVGTVLMGQDAANAGGILGDNELHIRHGNSAQTGVISGTALIVENSSSVNIALLSGTGAFCTLTFGDGDNDDIGILRYDHVSDHFDFVMSSVLVLQLNTGASNHAGLFFNDGNATNRFGIRIQAGLDTAATTGDITWVTLADGNGTDLSVIEFLDTGAPNAQFAAASDIRLKKNIRPTEVDGLDILSRIPLRAYDWKDASRGSHAIGYVAQEVQEVYPSMVSKRNDELWVGDGCLTPLVVKAIQQLNDRIKSLESKSRRPPHRVGA